MNRFIQHHASKIIGMINGWDRLRFRGTLRMLANVVGLGRFLSYTGRLLKDFGDYAHTLSQQTRQASLAVAESAGIAEGTQASWAAARGGCGSRWSSCSRWRRQRNAGDSLLGRHGLCIWPRQFRRPAILQ